MGSKSKSYQVRKRDPESAELKNMRTSIYNMLAPITGAAPTDMIAPSLGGGVSGANADAAVSRGKPSRNLANGLPPGYEIDSRGHIISGYKGGGDNEGAPIYKRNADGSIATIWNYNSGGGSSSQAAIPPGGAGTKWSETNFGSDWLTNRARVANALNQYDALSRNTQPLMNKVTGTADRISGLTDRMTGVTSDIGNLAGKIEGVGDRQSDLATTIRNFTRTGNVPSAVLDNLNKAVNSELNRNTGSALNDLAARGVMNSSVANRSLGGLADSAADAYAKNYLGAYNSVLSGYGQTSNTLAGAGDTYAKAISGQNDALTGLNNTVSGLNAAMGGYGKALTTNADLMKQAASMPQTLSQALMAQYAPAYQFWKDLQNSYDNREDYDTVVKQGK